MVEKGLHMPKAMAEIPLTKKELQLIDAYWRAANYLSVGQIYLSIIPC
jgi:xylulose-5-phosphate/fructose-6-phosphate phosphoketolase